ncbi:hypothetical protein HNR42_000673 [Deinobacterium chartae]|uniref:Lon N-terminal domain-containing protein n=2 Tax=Deinobacterium chartae TaxID=521158 RepID=A0A841HYG3_9DEIO|nr:hypothetical protein [Deinobacterium chartae]
MVVPLYIFEQRYRELLAKVRQSGESFGIVSLHPESEGEPLERVGRVGTLVSVTQVEDHPDGTSSIVVVGGERFRVDRFDAHSYSYLCAEVQLCPLEPSDLNALAVLSWDLFERFVSSARPDLQPTLRSEAPEDGVLLASFVAANLRLSGEQMQRVLEAPSLLARWQLLAQWIPEAKRTLN